jgi:putative transposon-encoded protein
MEIKITGKQTKIEGTIEKGVVKPFGTSAHINFPIKHMGKNVSVVIPIDASYGWILNENDLKKVIAGAKKYVKTLSDSRRKSHMVQTIKYFNPKSFEIEDLQKLIEILEQSKEPTHKELVKKIKRLYRI